MAIEITRQQPEPRPVTYTVSGLTSIELDMIRAGLNHISNLGRNDEYYYAASRAEYASLSEALFKEAQR